MEQAAFRQPSGRWPTGSSRSPWSLLSLAINLAGNARTGLWDRDEPRYAVAVREMRGRRRLALPHIQRRAALS